MEPKNAAERKKTFTSFLLLFCLCILLVMITGFFSVQVPFSENEKLQEKLAQAEKEKEFAGKFTAEFINVSKMLDAINDSSTQKSMTMEVVIQNKIAGLNAIISDSTSNRDLYLHAVHNLEVLQSSLKESRNKTDNDTELNKYKSEVEEQKKLKEKYYLDLIDCKTK